MDDELLGIMYQLLDRMTGFRRGPRQRFADATVVLVHLWATMRDRPVNWGCDARNWPARVPLRRLPSPSAMSARLRSDGVRRLYTRLLGEALARDNPALIGCFILDAKPMTVSAYSKDRQARRGFAYDSKARGYKLFLLTDARGWPLSFRVGAMNASEPVIARRLIRDIDRPGYILGDSIYDSTPLHAAVATHEQPLQLLAPRKAPGGNVGRRARHPARLRAIDLLESTNRFGPELYKRRTTIERFFSRLTGAPMGLKGLPNWVRTHRRVSRWVQAKIIAVALYIKHLRR